MNSRTKWVTSRLIWFEAGSRNILKQSFNNWIQKLCHIHGTGRKTRWYTQFNWVPLELTWRSLRTHGVPEAYVKWTQLLYHNVTSVARYLARTLPAFPITVCINQGLALSPLLFILCMDTTMTDLQSPHPWSLLYAVNVSLSKTENCPVLQTQTQVWKDWLSENWWHHHHLNTLGPSSPWTAKLYQTPEPVSTQHGWSGIISLWSCVTRECQFISIVHLMAHYRSECWPAMTKHEQVLHTMELKMLRWALGLTQLDRVMNEDVRKQWGVPLKMRE